MMKTASRLYQMWLLDYLISFISHKHIWNTSC
uniref:Uncharacterized protein n=1 Tax=Arundo donax TaxID=35708 RepID=A0A0A9ETB3_ARUDO